MSGLLFNTIGIQIFFGGVKFGNKKFGPKINTYLPLCTDDPLPTYINNFQTLN